MTATAPSPSTDVNEQSRQWAMLLHFSVLLGYLAPLAGFIAPLVIWQMKKDQFLWLDQHGKNVTNWIISSFLYTVVSGLLCLVLVGIPLLVILGVLAVLFPVLGAVKASNGETWKYPLAIPFFN